MRRPTAVFGFAGVTLALVLTLAGCLPGQPASAPTSTPALSQTAADLIAKTGDYYAQEQALSRAETTLTNECLATAGFPLPTSPPTTVSTDEEWRPDLAQREKTGYGLLAEIQQTGTGAPDPVDQYVRSLPAARQQRYQLDLFGPATSAASLVLGGKRITYSTQGCVADARTRIYGSDLTATRVFYLPQMYYIGLLTKVETEPAYLRAMREWSTCMGESGYHYTDSHDAKTQLIARYRSNPDARADQRLEIAVAVADARCATRIGLPATTEALLRKGAASLPAADITALNQVAGARVNSAQRATELIHT
jgi:hypothetical protein